MNYVPKGLSRLGHRQLLKLQKNSPTILVIGGVVGFGVTAVLAAKATRKIDPILESHKKQRFEIEMEASDTNQLVDQKQIVKLYSDTSIKLLRVYAPTIVVGTLSTASVLHGHRILQTRHIATMAAYTGLMDQYQSYRSRVAETLGEELEREIHEGAIARYEEDPNRPGEYKLKAKQVDQGPDSYLRPFFDESNRNWTKDPTTNYYFLKGVQNHLNNVLQVKGHVFLSDVYKDLGMEPVKETIVTGWLYDGDGDGYIDLGFMTEDNSQAVMFRNGAERSVRLNFNIDGVIWDKI